MLPQPFSSLNGSWKRIFWLQDTALKKKKNQSQDLVVWGQGRSVGAPYNQLHLSLAVPGWTFPGCMTGSIYLVLQGRHVLWVRKYVQELWVYQNEHSRWTTDLENDIYLMQKKKKGISVLVKIKGKLRRGVCNCKSTVSVRAENTGWLMKWLFYSDSGSAVVVYISDICHALQLLSCQCTQHIINKWASRKQLEIYMCYSVLSFVFISF